MVVVTRSKKRAATSKGLSMSPSSAWMIKVLFVLLLLLLLPQLVTARQKRRHRKVDLDLANLRKDCEKTVCHDRVLEESLNCVFACISPACYQHIYGESPLEDGEIDLFRGKQFEICAKDELGALRDRLVEERSTSSL